MLLDEIKQSQKDDQQVVTTVRGNTVNTYIQSRDGRLVTKTVTSKVKQPTPKVVTK